MFAYCLNNPVMLIDPTGDKPGDLFDAMDEAAQNAVSYIGSRSFIDGWEYGANIYSIDTVESAEVDVIEYTFGKTTSINKSTVSVQRTVKKYTYSCEVTNRDPWSVTIPIPSSDINRVAIFHTHPVGSGQGITQFSETDIQIAENRMIPIYVYGPNGQLHKYDPVTDCLSVWVGFPISTKQPWIQKCPWLEIED